MLPSSAALTLGSDPPGELFFLPLPPFLLGDFLASAAAFLAGEAEAVLSRFLFLLAGPPLLSAESLVEMSPTSATRRLAAEVAPDSNFRFL